MKKVLIIAGPTAIGKTALSVNLAHRLNGEIISADSMQIYKKMNIGTAKATSEEMDGIPHYLIDFVDPFDNYSASEYRTDALNAINEIHDKNKLPIVAGGTGLYINSILYEMDFGNKISDDNLRVKYQKIADEQGGEALHKILAHKDEDAAKIIHPNNIKKVIRALEINDLTGENIKNFSNDPVKNKDYEFILIGLTMNRTKLYARINKRVDIMLENGLIEEVDNLKKIGLNGSYQSMQGIGYKEVLKYLSGEYDHEILVKTLKLNSRRYAKRQLTWFRRYEDLKWINLDKFSKLEDLTDYVCEYVLSSD